MGSTLSSIVGSRGDGTPDRNSGERAPARRSKSGIEARTRKLISEGQLAPRDQVQGGVEGYECPICFLDYIAINHTKCCRATICTECFAQLLAKSDVVPCPFCTDNLKITFINSGAPRAGSGDTDTGSGAGGCPSRLKGLQDASIAATATEGKGTSGIGTGTSTSTGVFSSAEARRELEAEMTAHRHMAGDMEDISIVESRARTQSQQGYRAARMRVFGGTGGTGGTGTAQRSHSRSVLGNYHQQQQHQQSAAVRQARARDPPSSDEEDGVQRGQRGQGRVGQRPLPYLRPASSGTSSGTLGTSGSGGSGSGSPRAATAAPRQGQASRQGQGQGSAGQGSAGHGSARQAGPVREEWLALHDLLVSSRHEEVGIDTQSLSRMEERMMEQVGLGLGRRGIGRLVIHL
jgi:hypothetical protein